MVACLSASSSWSVASISASTLMVSTGGPFSRSASRRSPLSVAHALDLEAAGQGVRVVLQGDDPQDRRGERIEEDDAAFQESG